MSRWLGRFTIGVAALALVCAAVVGKQTMRSRPQPGPPEIGPATSAPIAGLRETPARAQSNSSPTRDDAANVGSLPLDVVVSGDLFDSSRSSAGAAPGRTGARPFLYGVVAGEGAKSRAYIEDPVTKVVRGYRIGDTVAGWRLDQIREDRVVITGAERGMLEVLLRDPIKPRPALFASVSLEVTTEAQIVAPPAVEAERIELASPPARQASTLNEYRDPVPRVVGPIPSQLFRPALAQ